MAKRRSKPSDKTLGGNVALDIGFNEYAGAHKVMASVMGKMLPLGATSTALKIDAGKTIALFNNSGSTVFYLTSGDPAMAAPTGGANGIPVAPYSWQIITMAGDTVLRSSSSSLFAYEVLDDTIYQ
jgi:hypothetical protein